MPSNLVTIGDETFKGCNSLTSINFPASLTTIGNRAFCNLKNLETITLAENSNLTTIGENALNDTAWYSTQSNNYTQPVYINGIELNYPPIK